MAGSFTMSPLSLRAGYTMRVHWAQRSALPFAAWCAAEPGPMVAPFWVPALRFACPGHETCHA